MAAIVVSLLKHGSKTRILAMAPSHQAADVLCERLGHAVSVVATVQGPTSMLPARESTNSKKGLTCSMLRPTTFELPAAFARESTRGYTFQTGATGSFDLPPVDLLASFTPKRVPSFYQHRSWRS